MSATVSESSHLQIVRSEVTVHYSNSNNEITQCLKFHGYINLQKCKLISKINLGSWVAQGSPQLSVTATQMGMCAIYLQGSE